MSASVLPTPRLQHIRNATPFRHLQFDKMGKGRRFYDVVVVCASFALSSGRLQPLLQHRGPVLADEYHDPQQPIVSSLRRATDLVLVKPGTDVYVSGDAHSLGGKPMREWPLMLRVEREGRVCVDKRLRLTGPRCWVKGLLGRSLTEAAPTTVVPLRYELAYGGWWFDRNDAADATPRMFGANPSGSGCFGNTDARGQAPARYEQDDVVAAPQIEHLDQPIRAANKAYRVAGLGPVARHWQPRPRFAGTYDSAWFEQFEREPIPDYPADFDYRFFQYAPEDQVVSDLLIGDESLQLAGCFADLPAVDAQLPHVWIEAVCRTADARQASEPLKLDTVQVDLDRREVHLTWRLTLDQTYDIVSVELFDRLIANGRRTRAAFRGVRS